MTEKEKDPIQEARELLVQQQQERTQLIRVELQKLYERLNFRLSPKAVISQEEGIRTFNEIILLE
jgi:hypothetical protein